MLSQAAFLLMLAPGPLSQEGLSGAVECEAEASVSMQHGYALLERISWDPYNEHEDLLQQAKQYEVDHSHFQ
jgi:hypothetical protein